MKCLTKKSNSAASLGPSKSAHRSWKKKNANELTVTLDPLIAKTKETIRLDSLGSMASRIDFALSVRLTDVPHRLAHYERITITILSLEELTEISTILSVARVITVLFAFTRE